MAGTDSSFIGMPSITMNTPTNHGLRDTQLGNPNGDVVDNSASNNPLNDNGVPPDLANASGAYLNMQSKAPEIQ